MKIETRLCSTCSLRQQPHFGDPLGFVPSRGASPYNCRKMITPRTGWQRTKGVSGKRSPKRRPGAFASQFCSFPIFSTLGRSQEGVRSLRSSLLLTGECPKIHQVRDELDSHVGVRFVKRSLRGIRVTCAPARQKTGCYAERQLDNYVYLGASTITRLLQFTPLPVHQTRTRSRMASLRRPSYKRVPTVTPMVPPLPSRTQMMLHTTRGGTCHRSMSSVGKQNHQFLRGSEQKPPEGTHNREFCNNTRLRSATCTLSPPSTFRSVGLVACSATHRSCRCLPTPFRPPHR